MLKNITDLHRKSILVMALALALVYITPLWYIHLTAPQYRDGLSMSIHINKITGGTEHDLKNINLLNHYVGMKEIHAESFPEFDIMPYILLFLIAGGIATFFYAKRFMVYLGVLTFAAVAIAGMVDFGAWLHDYGTNLSPDAPLKIPGLTFEPPLLACKAMMNFNACSWPHVGGTILLLVGAGLSFIALKETLAMRKEKGE